jgi:hypothetical protein
MTPTPIREMFDFMIEAAESPRKLLAFAGLLAGFILLGKGIIVAQNPDYPHWKTALLLGGGFIVGSVSGVALYWLKSSESHNTQMETLAIETLARQAELDRQAAQKYRVAPLSDKADDSTSIPPASQ